MTAFKTTRLGRMNNSKGKPVQSSFISSFIPPFFPKRTLWWLVIAPSPQETCVTTLFPLLLCHLKEICSISSFDDLPPALNSARDSVHRLARPLITSVVLSLCRCANTDTRLSDTLSLTGHFALAVRGGSLTSEMAPLRQSLPLCCAS